MAGAKVIVHGDIGVGKSTAVRAAMERLGWEKPGGFFTHWDGRGRGAEVLWIETWTGEKRPMAHRIARPAAPGGPAYALEPDFPVVALRALADADSGRPVVIDELGLIELGAPGFEAAVAKLFRGPAPVLAVVQFRALDRWLGAIGPENAAVLLRADAATRAALPGKIAALFRA